MPFFFPPTEPNFTKVAYLQNNISLIARPAANSYTPYQWIVQSDVSGIIANPLSVNPVTNPTILVTDTAFKQGTVTLRIQELDRGNIAGGTPKISIAVHNGVAWNIIDTLIIDNAAVVTATNPICHVITFEIPALPPLSPVQPMQLSIGLSMPLLSAIILPVNVLAIITATANEQ